MASGLVLDAGALIAAEKSKRIFQAVWTEAVEYRSIVPIVPALVVAQYWRGGSGAQAKVAKVLRSCNIQSFDFELAKIVGTMLSRSGTADVIDAAVVATAVQVNAAILTSDPKDIQLLLGAMNSRCEVIEV